MRDNSNNKRGKKAIKIKIFKMINQEDMKAEVVLAEIKADQLIQ